MACNKLLLVTALAVVSFCCVHAVRYNNPTIGGVAMDYCLGFATGCGQDAANEYCRRKGYSGGAKTFGALRLSSGRTRVLSNNAICDTSFHVCDTFSYIDCKGSGRFINPTINGQPLDGCASFESGCKNEAADGFCQLKGYSRASSFAKKALTSGTTLTLDGALCDTTVHGCGTFSYIQCV